MKRIVVLTIIMAFAMMASAVPAFATHDNCGNTTVPWEEIVDDTLDYGNPPAYLEKCPWTYIEFTEEDVISVVRGKGGDLIATLHNPTLDTRGVNVEVVVVADDDNQKAHLVEALFYGWSELGYVSHVLELAWYPGAEEGAPKGGVPSLRLVLVYPHSPWMTTPWVDDPDPGTS